MAGLDISEKRLPQDGRFSVRVRDAGVDVRLATMPTSYGESVVMRLLSQSTALLSLEKLGMAAHAEEHFRRLIERSAGMVLVTGPTGSGKTTTLYAALNHINRPGRESDHRRGPGRIPARPHHPGSGAAEDRPGLRARAAHGAAAGSGHPADRRNARPGDRRDRTARRDDRAPRVLDAAHHQRHREHQPAARHGRARIHDRRGGSRRRRAAPGAPRVHRLRAAGGADAEPARLARDLPSRTQCRTAMRSSPVPAARTAI